MIFVPCFNTCFTRGYRIARLFNALQPAALHLELLEIKGNIKSTLVKSDGIRYLKRPRCRLVSVPNIDSWGYSSTPNEADLNNALLHRTFHNHPPMFML